MGDRGNIAVLQHGDSKDAPEQVWFYTHWSGSEIEQTLRTALARRQRWSDESYLARIIFCELVKGSENEETGFGISTGLSDNEYPILVCDVPNQRVYFIDEDELDAGKVPDGWQPKTSWTFEAFLTAKPVAA
jgi:hypothetical protein